MIIFYSDNALFTRIFGVSVINKQSEENHFKVLCMIFEVKYQCNLTHIAYIIAIKFRSASAHI